MGIKVLHYLTMDNVFHCLAAYGGEGNRPIVCRVTLVSFLKYRCDEGFFQSSGMVPCCIEACKTRGSVGAISSAHSLKKRDGMASSP